jgi:probable LLM family oxidoreductase
MELGLYTFADLQPDGVHGRAMNAHQRMKDLMEEIKLADEVGLDVFGIGEHHRPDYAASSPATILAAAAVTTKNIKLSSAVTVLSSDDPVRVFQQFATVDQLSDGRAEIMVGRGSFIESYPLFGYNLQDYDMLFEEKLHLLLQINQQEIISSKGKLRASIANRGVYPRPYQAELPIWLAVGGTPESAVRAGRLGLPMAVAIIGGMPDRFVPFVNLYKETFKKAGHDHPYQLGINSFTYIADNSQQAADELYPTYAAMMNKLGKERGWPPTSRQQFDHLASSKGSLVIGSPQQVIDKLLYEHELFGNTRFLAQTSLGNLPHDKAMRSIELFGTKVAPEVRKATTQSS